MANKLQYNYEDLFIHKNQFEKTASNGKYYKIPFSNISKSNITSNMFQGNYIATTIYIVRKIHTIPKMNFDGELLIQHKSQSNDEKPLFISIPLKTQQAIVSKIDLLTQPNKDVELNLNEDIYSNTASYYENDKQRVIILHNVLNVGIQFENLSTGNVVTPKSTFTDVSIEPILGKEGFIEGNTEPTYVDNVAYCVPIDENDHTIQNDASTIIPAGSETNQHKTLVSQLTTATNFAIFFTLAIFVVWTIPTIYHMFIVLLIMNNYGLSRQQLFNRISGADIMTSFIFIGISFSLIVNGVGTKDPTVSVVGFYFLIFYMLIFARLQYDRLLNEGESFVNYITELHQTLQEKIREFIKESNKLNSLNIDEDSLPYLKEEKVKMDEITPDIGGFLMENTMNLFYDKGAQEQNGQNVSVETLSWKLKIPLFLVFFGGPFVTLILLDTLQQGLFITYLPVYFIFVSLYILAFYEYSYNKSSNENFEKYIFYEYLKKRTQKQAPAQAP